MGVDGMRLDAVPYLYDVKARIAESSRNASISETGPETDRRALSKTACCLRKPTSGRKMRLHISARVTSATGIFTSRSCRDVHALRMEDRFPIIDILAQTPALPKRANGALSA